MAVIYATLIVKGKKTIDQVPETIREEVKKLLVEGLGSLSRSQTRRTNDYQGMGSRELYRSGVHTHSRPSGVLGRVCSQDAGTAGYRDMGGKFHRSSWTFRVYRNAGVPCTYRGKAHPSSVGGKVTTDVGDKCLAGETRCEIKIL